MSGWKIADRYVAAVEKGRFFILLFWLVCLGLGAWKVSSLFVALMTQAFSFIGETNFKFDPPDNSDAVRSYVCYFNVLLILEFDFERTFLCRRISFHFIS